MNVFLSSINKYENLVDLGIYERILIHTYHTYHAKKFLKKYDKYDKYELLPHSKRGYLVV